MKRVLPLLTALIAGPLYAQGLGAQTPTVVERLHVSGVNLLDRRGAVVKLRGYNLGSATNTTSFIDGDVADIKASGLNVIRVTPQWYSDPSGTCTTSYPVSNDAYLPPASGGNAGNGFFTTGQLATLDKQVQSATARGVWTIIGITANNCDFYTNSTIQTEFDQMWAFLAARYANTPYVAALELMTEPNPLGDQYNNALVVVMYEAAITAIRAVDPATPIMVGPAKNYNPRSLPPVYLADQSNIAYAANWYELGGSVSGVSVGYTKQVKYAGGPYTGYPAPYLDTKGDQPSVSCTYPNIGASASMTKASLATMLDDCPMQFQANYNVPTIIEQIGVRSLTPDSFTYMGDQLDTLNARNLSWMVWVYRAGAGASPVGDGTNGGNSGDLDEVFQDGSSAWHKKDASITCAAIDWGNGYTSTCGHDWYGMIATKGTT